MKILIALSSWHPHYTSSSIGKIVYHIASHLRRIGVSVDICAPVGGDIEVINPKYIYITQKYVSLNYFFRMIYYWRKVINFIKEKYNEYDLFWVHNPNPLIWKTIERKYMNKILFTFHTTYSGINKKSKFKTLKSKIYLWFMSKSEIKFFAKLEGIGYKNRIIVISPIIKDELIALGVPQDKIIYVPNGVDIKKFRAIDQRKKMELREKFGIPKDKIVLLSLGRITGSKNPFKLLETFLTLETMFPNAFLVIAGKGDLLPKIRKRTKGNQNIKLMGFVSEDDKPDLMACCDCYITASDYEGQPLTLLEAMASGLACITSQIPNLKDIIERANCGISINFDNVTKAAHEIAEFLKTQNIELLKKNARKYAEKYHNWDIITNRYLKEFKKFEERVR